MDPRGTRVTGLDSLLVDQSLGRSDRNQPLLMINHSNPLPLGHVCARVRARKLSLLNLRFRASMWALFWALLLSFLILNLWVLMQFLPLI